jgi:hypothetical protein
MPRHSLAAQLASDLREMAYSLRAFCFGGPRVRRVRRHIPAVALLLCGAELRFGLAPAVISRGSGSPLTVDFQAPIRGSSKRLTEKSSTSGVGFRAGAWLRGVPFVSLSLLLGVRAVFVRLQVSLLCFSVVSVSSWLWR